MAKLDPEQERRRLAEFYAGQLDGELEKLAAQAYELTELAREVLRAQMSRRGLEFTFMEQPPVVLRKQPDLIPGDPPPAQRAKEEPEPEDSHFELRTMITLRQFRDLPDALLAKACLNSAGIECLLLDDNLVRLDWLWSNLVGGVKLNVEASEAESALQILNQSIPEKIEVAGMGEYEQPHCPNCQSLDITFKELNRPVAYASLWLNVPLPVHRKAWRCHSCNVEWEDEEQAPSPESAR